MDLNKRLPSRYTASPNIHLGGFEIDVGTTEGEEALPQVSAARNGGGGAATTVWAPPEPTLAVLADRPELDEYEVRIFDEELRQLVAAIEIVSPSNKDRVVHRQAFTAKCSTLLRQGVSVSIIDIVTDRQGNLYSELLDLIGHTDPSLGKPPPSQYAVESRWRHQEPSWWLETWAYPLAIGKPLPTLPLWLAEDLAVPLDLESSYEETCRSLRIT